MSKRIRLHTTWIVIAVAGLAGAIATSVPGDATLLWAKYRLIWKNREMEKANQRLTEQINLLRHETENRVKSHSGYPPDGGIKQPLRKGLRATREI